MIDPTDLHPGDLYRMHVRYPNASEDVEYQVRFVGHAETPSGPALDVMEVERFDHRFVGTASRVIRPAHVVAVGPIDGPKLIMSAAAKESAAKRAATNGHRERPAKPAAPAIPDGHVHITIAGRAFRLLKSDAAMRDIDDVGIEGVIDDAVFTKRGRWGGGTYSITCTKDQAAVIADWFHGVAADIRVATGNDRDDRNDMRSCIEAAAKIRAVIG